jgi:hypothetical protein
MLLEKAVAFLLVFALLYALAVGVLAAASASNKRYLAGCEDATCTDPEQLERLFLISHKKIGRGEVAWHHLLEWDGIAKVRHQMQYGSDHCPPRCPHCSTAAERTARRSVHSWARARLGCQLVRQWRAYVRFCGIRASGRMAVRAATAGGA